MARSLSNAKLLSALVADGFSTTITRRGYAAGSQGVASSVVRGGGATNPRSVNVVKNSGEDKVGSAFKVSWVPEPFHRVCGVGDRTGPPDVRGLQMCKKMASKSNGPALVGPQPQNRVLRTREWRRRD